MLAVKETDYESATARLLEAQVTAEEAKAAAQAADAYTQSKQTLYDEALSARNAAKAAYEVAQQELRLVQQAAQNASALLVKISGTAMSAGAKLDKRLVLAADANRKVRMQSVPALVILATDDKGAGMTCSWAWLLTTNWLASAPDVHAAAAAIAEAACGCSLMRCLCVQVAEAERSLQLLKSQLLLAQAKQQSIKLQIKYSQVRGPSVLRLGIVGAETISKAACDSCHPAHSIHAVLPSLWYMGHAQS